MTKSTSRYAAHSWRDFAPDQKAIRLPVGFEARLDRGETILMSGRASGQGTVARELAAHTVHGAAALFARESGIDFSSVLPSVEVIVGLLEGADTETSKRPDGDSMQHQFVLVDLTDVTPLKLLVGTGTGHHVNEEFSQPFIMRTALEYMRQGACILAVKNSTRSGRHAAGTATLLSAISENGGALCDEDGLGIVDLGRKMTAYIRGINAEEQAKGMPRAVRESQLKRTNTEMIAGRVQCHVATPCPPGFSHVWLKSAQGNPTTRLLHLDTDACRPADDEVAHGLSEVRYPPGHSLAGSRVDQVDNVRFVLTHFGKVGWTRQKIVDALIERSYSTEMLRSRSGVQASLPAGSNHEALTAILDNLDTYETGILKRSVGGGIDPISISGCFPPDGPWADQSDFARIRSHLQERRTAVDTFTKLTFSGLRATLDGVPVVMVSDTGRTRRSRSGQLQYYTFFLAEGYSDVCRAPEFNRSIAPMEFADSIVRGLLAAGDVPLDLFEPHELAPSVNPELQRLNGKKVRLTAEVDALERRREGILMRLEEVDADGVPVLTGALLRDSQSRYNEIAQVELPRTRRDLASVSYEIDGILAKQPKSAPVDVLLHLVESLRDPTERKFRAHWLASLRNVCFTGSCSEREGRQLKVVDWRGLIVLHRDKVEVAIPFGGRFEYHAKSPLQDPVEAAERMSVAAMSAGVVPRAGTRRLPPQKLADLARELGISTEHMLLNGCDDPRIVATATALLRNKGSVAAAVTETGESELFVRRIREVHIEGETDQPWKRRQSALRAAFYNVASRNNGLVRASQVLEASCGSSLGQVYNVFHDLARTSSRWISERKAGYRLKACTCGSTDAFELSIPEALGAVCAECRKDEAGIEWPGNSYDRYLRQSR